MIPNQFQYNQAKDFWPLLKRRWHLSYPLRKLTYFLAGGLAWASTVWVDSLW